MRGERREEKGERKIRHRTLHSSANHTTELLTAFVASPGSLSSRAPSRTGSRSPAGKQARASSSSSRLRRPWLRSPVGPPRRRRAPRFPRVSGLLSDNFVLEVE